MKCYYLGDKKITEAEAKEIEAKNREILRDGTVEELLQIRHVSCAAMRRTTRRRGSGWRREKRPI